MNKTTKTKTAKPANSTIAMRRDVRALILRAANHHSAPPVPDKADDTALLEAARCAQNEAGSFTDMFNTVTAVNGAIEVLFQMIRPRGDVPEGVNWTVVADLLDDARRRLGPVYSAAAHLEQYERKSEGEATNAA